MNRFLQFNESVESSLYPTDQMFDSSHTSINDAVAVLSPALFNETVGNFPEPIQFSDVVLKNGKEIEPPLFACWFANYGKVSPTVEPSSNSFTTPQISPYNPYFRIANPLSKRGGGITLYVTVTYSYDDLNRLLTATASVASSSPYTYTYSYSAIGNISSSTPSGAYTYAGTNYANPHAATSIGATSQSYDNNGNLTSDGTWNNSWNYKNQLIQSINNSNTATSTYLYDENGNRVKLMEGNTTTYFPNKYFNQIGTTGTTTKHIFAGDLLVATIEKLGSATSTTHYIHTDHLGGTNAITDSTGALSQVLDFMPFGATRIDSKSGGYGGEKVQYAGTQKDALNGLNYMSARYQNPAQGRFISEDPIFNGDPKKQNLQNPQSLNSYSYANDNPIVNKDPSGKSVWDFGFSVSGGELPVGLNAGYLVDPEVGYRTYYFFTAGESYGASVKYDPNGSLKDANPNSSDKVQKGYVIAPGVGRYNSTEAQQNISDPFDFSNNKEKSNGWAFGAEIGASYGVGAEGKMKYFEKYKNTQSQASNGTSIVSNSSQTARTSNQINTSNKTSNYLSATLNLLHNTLVQLKSALTSNSSQ
ncbi:MAG: hypothetical protein NTZ13_01060 [Candidatus Parcubacteria bacterium]|nr:hypothetical protein [Candidatus Parcubacteria bacterium]